MASGTSVEGVVDNGDAGEGSSSRIRRNRGESIEEDSEDEEKEKERQDRITSLDGTGGKSPLGGATGIQRHKSERERKLGHRRVGVGGEITYKKIQTSTIMGSIQLGIQHAVGGLASKPERDLLMQDFMTVETTNFLCEGSNHTPAHHFTDFKFKTYAPIAFRYFRDLFGIQPDDFLISMCSSSLRELSNPGASGSIFYLTADDEFIIKTVQHKEGEFLQKLLPGYYMNLNQNPRTLLPKFFGLYCYQCNSKNVRLVAMNNLLPSWVTMHQKYDLKGSTYKRKANKSERQKKSPTYKDLDFMEHHPEGIYLEADTYSALVKTIQRDCRVLESFKIMDYSLLVGIHNLDQAAREKAERRSEERKAGEQESAERAAQAADGGVSEAPAGPPSGTSLNRSRSINRQRLVAHSTAMESIQAESEPIDEEEDVPPGGIPARNAKGERLLLFLGVIDILQSYRLKKKLEHTWKSMIHDGDTVSVHRPGFYAQRFQDFMAKTVFTKIQSPLKHSPSKRKSLSQQAQPTSLVQRVLGASRQAGGALAATANATVNMGGMSDAEAAGPSATVAAEPEPSATAAVAAAPGPSSAQGSHHHGASSQTPSKPGSPVTPTPVPTAPETPSQSSLPVVTTTPANYPAVLKDRAPSQKSRVPPPVPPRSPKRGGGHHFAAHHRGGGGMCSIFPAWSILSASPEPQASQLRRHSALGLITNTSNTTLRRNEEQPYYYHFPEIPSPRTRHLHQCDVHVVPVRSKPAKRMPHPASDRCAMQSHSLPYMQNQTTTHEDNLCCDSDHSDAIGTDPFNRVITGKMVSVKQLQKRLKTLSEIERFENPGAKRGSCDYSTSPSHFPDNRHTTQYKGPIAFNESCSQLDHIESSEWKSHNLLAQSSFEVSEDISDLEDLV